MNPPTNGDHALVRRGPIERDGRRVIAWFSHGACSAVACKMALEHYGPDIEVVNIHLDGEHEDNPRFLADCEAWFDHEIKPIQSTKYDPPHHFEVARRKKYVNGIHGAPCTGELKKAVRHAYQHPDDIHVWGYAMNKRDFDRAVRFVEQNVEESWFPLIQRRLYKSHCLALVQRAGIELPWMYRHGYVNNNCIGCWKGGMGYWNKVREDFPEVFAEAARIEREEVGASTINGIYLDELEPGRGRYKDEAPACDLNCATVESEWTPVTLRGAA